MCQYKDGEITSYAIAKSQSPNRVQLRCVDGSWETNGDFVFCLNPLTGSNCGVSGSSSGTGPLSYRIVSIP